ncbi:MAG: 16S rRNA (cytosine(1402)-N(4))-methyltransferase RsmH [Flavobacteriales bacterium]
MEESVYHVPVLLEESVNGLAIDAKGTYVDVTFGGGGHSRRILEDLNEGKLYAFDQDRDVLENVPEHKGFKLIMQNFRYIKTSLLMYGVKQVDGILADLGVSSHQFDTAERGFSFRFDAELDMRMNSSNGVTAKELIAQYSETDLVRIFSDYGEVTNSKKLARIIVAKRQEKAIVTTGDLIGILEPLTTPKHANKYYAQVFQALRIEVNDEMAVLREFLESTVPLLKTGGRLSVITYHSLEDRLVKRFIQSGNFKGEVVKDFYGNPIVPFKKINRKPILSTQQELKDNTRSRSAKLRIAEKIEFNG